MEWVQTTAKTVEEAKELALDQLGVADDDAEFEVLEEPRPGLFGRVRGEARVRARVRPSRPRPKVDRRERRRRPATTGTEGGAMSSVTELDRDAGSSDLADVGPESEAAPLPLPEVTASASGRQRAAKAPRAPRKPSTAVAAISEPAGISEAIDDEAVDAPAIDGEAVDDDDGVSAQRVGPAAAAFLEGLAEALDLDATTAIGGAGTELEVRLEGADLGLLIGPRGQTLLAVQDLVRTVSQRGVTDHGRLHVDIGGYRERRRAALARFTTDVAAQVVASGVPRMLEAMASADRKVVHDTAGTIDGVETRSEGEDPNRKVVILPISS